MITLTDYWKGRDSQYASELTDAIRANAAITIEKANALLDAFGESRGVTSGWRPSAINAATPNAAPLSKHLTGQAVDIADHEGDLDQWCIDNQATLVGLGLWQEHPASTKGWCHIQIVAPKSGNRVFYP